MSPKGFLRHILAYLSQTCFYLSLIRRKISEGAGLPHKYSKDQTPWNQLTR